MKMVTDKNDSVFTADSSHISSFHSLKKNPPGAALDTINYYCNIINTKVGIF